MNKYDLIWNFTKSRLNNDRGIDYDYGWIDYKDMVGMWDAMSSNEDPDVINLITPNDNDYPIPLKKLVDNSNNYYWDEICVKQDITQEFVKLFKDKLTKEFFEREDLEDEFIIKNWPHLSSPYLFEIRANFQTKKTKSLFLKLIQKIANTLRKKDSLNKVQKEKVNDFFYALSCVFSLDSLVNLKNHYTKIQLNKIINDIVFIYAYMNGLKMGNELTPFVPHLVAMHFDLLEPEKVLPKKRIKRTLRASMSKHLLTKAFVDNADITEKEKEDIIEKINSLKDLFWVQDLLKDNRFVQNMPFEKLDHPLSWDVILSTFSCMSTDELYCFINSHKKQIEQSKNLEDIYDIIIKLILSNGKTTSYEEIIEDIFSKIPGILKVDQRKLTQDKMMPLNCFVKIHANFLFYDLDIDKWGAINLADHIEEKEENFIDF